MSRSTLLILCAISIFVGCRAVADNFHLVTGTDPISEAVNADRAQISAHSRGSEFSNPGKIAKRSPNIEPFNDTTPCTGQIISAIDLNNLDITGCDKISLTYGVATGDLQAAMGNPLCAVRAPSYCVLAPCKLERTSAGNTCDSIARWISTTYHNITTPQFQNSNPRILGSCNNLTEHHYVCSSPPGSAYMLFPAATRTNSTSKQSHPKINTGSSMIKSTLTIQTLHTLRIRPSPVSTSSTPNIPTPTVSGITPSCTAYALVVHNDHCNKITNKYNITTAQFVNWNKQLGNVTEYCNTSLWANYYYCVGITDPLSNQNDTMSTPSAPSIGHGIKGMALTTPSITRSTIPTVVPVVASIVTITSTVQTLLVGTATNAIPQTASLPQPTLSSACNKSCVRKRSRVLGFEEGGVVG